MKKLSKRRWLIGTTAGLSGLSPRREPGRERQEPRPTTLADTVIRPAELCMRVGQLATDEAVVDDGPEFGTISGPGTSYVYDSTQRVKLTWGGAIFTATSIYDADGRLLSTGTTGTPRVYSYDGATGRTTITDADGNETLLPGSSEDDLMKRHEPCAKNGGCAFRPTMALQVVIAHPP